jgi:hypothetical protein
MLLELAPRSLVLRLGLEPILQQYITNDSKHFFKPFYIPCTCSSWDLCSFWTTKHFPFIKSVCHLKIETRVFGSRPKLQELQVSALTTLSIVHNGDTPWEQKKQTDRPIFKVQTWALGLNREGIWARDQNIWIIIKMSRSKYGLVGH